MKRKELLTTITDYFASIRGMMQVLQGLADDAADAGEAELQGLSEEALDALETLNEEARTVSDRLEAPEDERASSHSAPKQKDWASRASEVSDAVQRAKGSVDDILSGWETPGHFDDSAILRVSNLGDGMENAAKDADALQGTLDDVAGLVDNAEDIEGDDGPPPQLDDVRAVLDEFSGAVEKFVTDAVSVSASIDDWVMRRSAPSAATRAKKLAAIRGGHKS